MDGPQLNEINKDYNIEIDGYTFNPLFKNGAKDYLGYSKEILGSAQINLFHLKCLLMIRVE